MSLWEETVIIVLPFPSENQLKILVPNPTSEDHPPICLPIQRYMEGVVDLAMELAGTLLQGDGPTIVCHPSPK